MHNSNPKTVAKLAHNEFSHMNQEEINSKLKGFKVNGFNRITKRGVGTAIRYSSFNGAVIKIPFYSYVPTAGYTAPASVGLIRDFNFSVKHKYLYSYCI